MQMIEMPWLDKAHVFKGSLDGAVERANDLYWEMEVVEENGSWLVKGGDHYVLKADSIEDVQSFLYGFGLAYGCVGSDVWEQAVVQLKILVGEA